MRINKEILELAMLVIGQDDVSSHVKERFLTELVLPQSVLVKTDNPDEPMTVEKRDSKLFTEEAPKIQTVKRPTEEDKYYKQKHVKENADAIREQLDQFNKDGE